MNESVYQAYVDGIVEICNASIFIEACEPECCEHKPVVPWMVKRILTARRLIENQVKGSLT